jgi:membrane protein involved in colicin uptake
MTLLRQAELTALAGKYEELLRQQSGGAEAAASSPAQLRPGIVNELRRAQHGLLREREERRRAEGDAAEQAKRAAACERALLQEQERANELTRQVLTLSPNSAKLLAEPLATRDEAAATAAAAFAAAAATAAAPSGEVEALRVAAAEATQRAAAAEVSVTFALAREAEAREELAAERARWEAARTRAPVDEERLQEAAQGRASALREVDTMRNRLRAIEAERAEEKKSAAAREAKLRSRLDALSVGSGGSEAHRMGGGKLPQSSPPPTTPSLSRPNDVTL